MPNNSASPNNHNDKKNIVLQKSVSNKHLIVFAVIGLIAISVIVIAFKFGSLPPSSTSKAQASKSNEVMHPLTLFDDGKAHHFEYAADDIKIRYFILKSSDGVIRAAFDACDVCWPAGKGYVQEDDTMVCRNCGRRFASIRINEIKGGCNPAPLTRTIVDDQLVIKADDIQQGRRYFDFSKRS